MCCDGLYQRYLAQRLKDEFELIGLVLYKGPNSSRNLWVRVSRYFNPTRFFRYIVACSFHYFYWLRSRSYIQNIFFKNDISPCFPNNIPTIRITDVNNQEAVSFVKNLAPDVVCVNGTNLLRKPMLELIPGIPFGIVNLHTGLSPYTRGGNCDLFALLEGHPELVGVTIHYINEGIDSGDIILTARPDLKEGDIFEIVEAKSFKLGIDLMVVAIKQIVEGCAKRVKQWESGKLFLKRTGYVYEPYLRVKVNHFLKKGLVRDYLRNKEARDRGIKLIGDTV